ncbi:MULTISPECIES: hypothetical protein [unclassified Streptomyces]|nr:hypothetical protein [Streptomyces sp. NBC_00273]
MEVEVDAPYAYAGDPVQLHRLLRPRGAGGVVGEGGALVEWD